MSEGQRSTPVVLVVCMINSIHAARWVAAIRFLDVRLVLFPCLKAPLSPDFEPARPVTNEQELATLAAGEIGYVPSAELPAVDAGEVETADVYPHVMPITRVTPNLMPTPDALCSVVKTLRPDLVHSMELQHAGYLVFEARQRMGDLFPSWLASSWGSDIFLYRKFASHRKHLVSLIRTVDGLHSDCARDIQIAGRMGFQGLAFPQMPASGGVDFSALPALSDLPPPSARRTLLIKGYHHWAGRGLHILLALHLIAPQIRHFRIVVTHAGPAVKAMVENLVREDGLDIELHPYLPSHRDAMARLEAARVVVGYGISDGISTTLLESMVLGAFMIQASSCCGGEWIENFKTGMLVNPDDTSALARAILRAATDDRLVDNAAPVNRQTVEERWSAAVNGPLIRDAYLELIAARNV